MESGIIPIITAIVGAALALIGREFVEWYKGPRLEIDFEKIWGLKPFIQDFIDSTMAEAEGTHRIKYLRLVVRNKGRKPAMNCEAKVEFAMTDFLNTGSSFTTDKAVLHWSRNGPVPYSEHWQITQGQSDNVDTIYAPINLNINDEETVDVFSLPYSFSTMPDTGPSPIPSGNIKVASLRQLFILPNMTYVCKVTVYASNTNPKSFNFKVNWDGKFEGFDKAFTKF